MNNEDLINFAQILLSHKDTEAYILDMTNKKGVYALNGELGFRLDLFSDKLNGYYLEFVTFKDGNVSNKVYPTYRTENFSAIKPILEQMTELISKDKPSDKPSIVLNYIKLFTQILKNEQYPSNYMVIHNKHGIAVREEDKRFVVRLTNEELNKVNYITNLEPTSLITFNITGIPDSNTVQLHFPLCLIEPSLIPQQQTIKNEANLTDNIDDWLTKIKTSKDKPSLGLSNILNYLELQTKLHKNDATLEKKKLKL